MISLRYDSSGLVFALSRVGVAPGRGGSLIEVEALPPMPEAIPAEKKLPMLYVRGGELVWEMVVDPNAPDPDAPREPPPEPEPEPTREEVRAERAAAYRAEVDPLTAEIARLRDMAPDDPRIAEAEAEREAAVARVVAAHPYPETETEEEGGEA